MASRSGSVELLVAVGKSLLALLPGDGRLPRGGTRRKLDLVVELIDFLETETLGLIDEHVDEENAQEAASEPDEEDLGLQVGGARSVVDQVGRREGNSPVEQPVGGGGDAQGLGTGAQREDLTRDDPGKRAPGRGEEENVDADKGHRSLLTGFVRDIDVTDVVVLARLIKTGRCVLSGREGSGHGDDELCGTHADSTGKQHRTTTPFIREIEARNGRADVNGRCDHADDEGLADTRILEVLGAVVEDEVDACKLLESL